MNNSIEWLVFAGVWFFVGCIVMLAGTMFHEIMVFICFGMAILNFGFIVKDLTGGEKEERKEKTGDTSL